MYFQISSDILGKTKKCPSQFQCLKEGSRPKCKIERPFEDSWVFVQSTEQDACPYKKSFGYGYICKCPTRLEIYKRYKI